MIIRILLMVIAGLHAAIHLLGFVKAFGLARVEQLSKPISKPAGVLWLVAAGLFFYGLLLFLLKNKLWWACGLAGIVLSQSLIMLYWQDAKYGTIANAILLLACIVGYGQWDFIRTVESEVNTLIKSAGQSHALAEGVSAEALPAPVKRWMQFSRAEKVRSSRTAHLYQAGRMKLSPEGDWKQVQAEQWFTLQRPGFLWSAQVGSGSLLQFSGRDRYTSGKGSMLINLYSLVPVVNASGMQIDQGVAVRYLAEMVWFPQAAMSPYLRWEQTGPLQAKATLAYMSTEVKGEFTFNSIGQAVRFEALRYYDKTGSMEKWVIDIDEDSYRAFDRVRVPTRARVTWQLAGGGFTWYELEINGVEYQ
ncbi:DUF6544 family protein [Roseivirga sp. BDSF3-8]|uniref:DUF6920 family protein n=1 Tax=Roseivirga sp. BDSF3-8 TaxID=3241598 RepID=UPI003532330F